jgi:hypothetical protein
MSPDLVVQVIVALIGLCGIIITSVAVPYFRSKTTVEQRDTIEYWVGIAVDAYEIIIKGDKMGGLRKEKVLEYIHSKGFNISEADLDLLIEATVKVMNDTKNEATKD